MNTSKGHYCLIQFCPNPSRAEAINVGVLLFCPEQGFIGARTARGNQRIAGFFHRTTFNKHQLNAAKKAIEKRLEVEREQFKTLDDLQRFIDTRANQIVITQPRSVRVENPESDLAELFSELVGEEAKPGIEPSVSPTLPVLDETFRRLLPSERVQIDPPAFEVPVYEQKITAKYTYQNGALNLVKPEAFPTDESKAARRALLLAAEGDLIVRHCKEPGEEARLIVVSANAGDEAADRIEVRVARLFGEYKVRFVRRSEVDGFAREVERDVTAH